MLESMAPLLIGAVVGCLIFYFIRRYNKFTPSMLVATIAGNRDFHLWYLAGVAVGFFLYGVYVLLVAILFHRGKIRDKGEFDRMPPGETDENE